MHQSGHLSANPGQGMGGAAVALAMQGDTERAWEMFAMLNPVNHGSEPEQIERYKVEPSLCVRIFTAQNRILAVVVGPGTPARRA